MFKWLTTSKKGFTLVELMIVLVLLGLGAFALINLFRVAYRSFEKTEERYEKQETVKNLAEFLQKEAKIASATSATIFRNINVVPSGDNTDSSYSYLYCKPVYYNPGGSGDNKYVETNTGSLECAGYYLYVLEKNATPPGICLNKNMPLYVTFEVVKLDSHGFDPSDSNYHPVNQPEIKVNIMAVENDAEFVSNASYSNATGYFEPSSDDDIFYGLNVNYHFPNMVFGAGGTSVVNSVSSVKINNVTYATADVDGIVLQLTIDSILSGDNTEAATTVSSFCFIATASYGQKSGEVGLLCDFRDNCLLTNAPGRLFVKTYYAISPPIADFIAKHETLRAAVRAMLKPLVVIAEYSLNNELIAEAAPSLIAVFALGLPLSGAAVIMNKKRKRETGN